MLFNDVDVDVEQNPWLSDFDMKRFPELLVYTNKPNTRVTWLSPASVFTVNSLPKIVQEHIT